MTVVNGFVSLVGAGPGHPDYLTLKAARRLEEADLVLYDALVSDEVRGIASRAEHIYVGKRAGREHTSQEMIERLLIDGARQGRRVVRLKSGDPLVFGRAGEEIAALRAAGISFDIVPGVTAALAAAAETEIPLTLRDSASALVFATGQDANGETLPSWAGLALSGATVAVYMGRAVAAKVAARLIEAGMRPTTPVAVIENASRPGHRAYVGELSELARIAANGDPAGPALIIVGDVVAEGAVSTRPVSLAALVAA